MKEKKKEKVVTEEKVEKEEITFETPSNKKGKKKLVIGIFIAVLLIGGALASYFIFCNGGKKTDPKKETKKDEDKKKSAYYITDNSIQDFDLRFLQLENTEQNKIYSPLSIKYALQMLKEGSDGETKTQIENIIGDYKGHKYTNSNNLSLANGLFVKDSYKDSIKDTYIKTLTDKYNADVVFDSFSSTSTLNNWVGDKTLGLIKDMFNDDVLSLDYILVNALGIDMDWVNQIRSDKKYYEVNFKREKYNTSLSPYNEYDNSKFNGSKDVKSAKIAAITNKYDIVNELGRDKIAEILKTEYQKWLDEGAPGACEDFGQTGGGFLGAEKLESGQAFIDKYLDTYINELNENYKHNSSSTDFYWYTDDNVKVFAKDLKEYDGTTLEYVGIMPKTESLNTYVNNLKASDVTKLINSLKDTSLDSFKDGVVTELTGDIPMFNFDYELQLKDDLQKLGIKDVFDSSKADLSKLSTDKSTYISYASHKANIEFSNDGIKAAAVTGIGGRGGGDCGFYYFFDVPVEKIDLSFDKPYLFLIIDKSTNEVWFTGTVYEPTEYVSNY